MTNATITANTKVGNNLQVPRVIYLSWVPDRLEQANHCVTDFWTTLESYKSDVYDTPIKTVDPRLYSIKLPTAGDLVNTRISSPMAIENINDVTDVIAFLSDDYIVTEPHVSELSDLSQFVRRKRNELAAREKDSPECDEQKELSMWLILVHKMSPPSTYSLVAETSPEWWHELLDGNAYLLTDKEYRQQFKEQLHDAAERLREHRRRTCAKCCHPHETGGSGEAVPHKKGWLHRLLRKAA